MEKRYRKIIEDGLDKCEVSKHLLIEFLLSKIEKQEWDSVVEIAESIRQIIIEEDCLIKYLDIE